MLWPATVSVCASQLSSFSFCLSMNHLQAHSANFQQDSFGKVPMACVFVCRGWWCCHFGKATAHIAAITTAEKCFSATYNYYRLQIAVLASEALARKGETLRICVWMCVDTHKQTETQRQRKMRNDYSSHQKPQLKKMGELTYLWVSFRFKTYTDFQG